MYYHQNAPVHQYSPFQTMPTVQYKQHATIHPPRINQIYQAQSQIQPSQSSNFRYMQNSQQLKQSTLSTFQPYQPDPEVEKIISKYNTTQKNTQIEQPVTHWPSNSIQQNQSNQFRDQNQNSKDEQEFKDNNTPLHFQFDDIKQRKPNLEQKNYSPDKNDFKDFIPLKQEQVALPEQNDKIVKLIVSGIIVLLILYIISFLLLK
ncbi:unnamed protein product (macronuclear) [Paramecium tetraurelia]|uniref:Transmembrane protein n=1 Tax=Paramecium tetraurelia TaxID=5888 RepID=A0E8D0_PARTE|nr:uncharacterized protein GSPATT00024275001 [Paramecium tetraurelia]CAK91547.1 unnamed protein product [Paramecium tetraurelia]|eukprot:XP_001458944.1 hypothetical protein (macronuclear) [Paramecium tetraurelia strain d4-2]